MEEARIGLVVVEEDGRIGLVVVEEARIGLVVVGGGRIGLVVVEDILLLQYRFGCLAANIVVVVDLAMPSGPAL